MRTARAAVRLLGALPELAEKGNPNAASDAGAAALLLDACVEGALLNVGINLSGIEDAGLRRGDAAGDGRAPGASRSGCARRSSRSFASASSLSAAACARLFH